MVRLPLGRWNGEWNYIEVHILIRFFFLGIVKRADQASALEKRFFFARSSSSLTLYP